MNELTRRNRLASMFQQHAASWSTIARTNPAMYDRATWSAAYWYRRARRIMDIV